MPDKRTVKSEQPEGFHFFFETEAVGFDPVTFRASASNGALRGEASRLGVEAITSLELDGSVLRQNNGRNFWLHVHLIADVVQSCVVTLDTIRTTIDREFGVCCKPEEQCPSKGGDVFVDPLGEYDSEPVVDGIIDVGGVVMDDLALAVDMYPRKLGAVFQHEVLSEEICDSSFSSLSVLKPKR